MISWIIALLGFSMGLYCLLPKRWVTVRPWIPLLVAFAVCGLPLWHGVSLGDLLRGAFGDVSILSLALLLAATVTRLGGPVLLPERDKTALLLLIVAVALPFYAATMGMSYEDPYRWGYTYQLALALLPLTLVAVGLRAGWVALSFSVAALAWTSGWVLESTNLWDYLLDPLLVLYGLGYLMRRLLTLFTGAAPARG